MQFSLFDLEIERTDDEEQEVQNFENDGSSENENCVAQVLRQIPSFEFVYTLLQDKLEVLETFGPDRELSFSLGGQEIKAVFSENNTDPDEIEKHTITLSNFTEFDQNEISAEDFFGLRLYQSYDEHNFLWEHSFGLIKAIEVKEKKDCGNPGETLTLIAKTQPEKRDVTWSIAKKADGVDASINKKSGVLRIWSTSEDSGWVQVRATDAVYPEEFFEARLPIGCCCSGDEECDNKTPGKGSQKLSSIDIQISLGKNDDGLTAGTLYIDSDEMSPSLGTPGSLLFTSLTDDVQVLVDDNFFIRQLIAPETFVDVVVINNFSYEIRFYKPSQMGEKVDGFFEIEGAAAPFSRWRIENPDASDSVYNRLKVTENDNEHIYELEGNTWTLSKYGGQKKISVEKIRNGSSLIETRSVMDGNDVVASTIETTRFEFPWDTEIIKTVNDPEGLKLTTTKTYYDEPSDDPFPQFTEKNGRYGKVKKQLNPDGSWFRYDYDNEGRVVSIVKSWLDRDSDATPAVVRAVTYSYTPVDARDTEEDIDMFNPRTETETIEGIVVSKTFYAYFTDADGNRVEIVERAPSQDASYSDESNLRTTRTYYPYDETEPGSSKKIKSIEYPDGRLDSFSYQFGTYTENENTPGTFNAGGGSDIREISTYGTLLNPDGVADKTTRDITITNSRGDVFLNESRVFDGAGYHRINWTVYKYDDKGHVSETYRSDGTINESAWDCCNKDYEKDSLGIITDYVYNDLKRLESMTRNGVSTSYVYDGAGRRLSQTT
ncbi:MAG: hypothetical protein HQK83_20580, partial [Fibrobacteria bacterium]|nr:hypothetical protein [Fibrobacteria bacterium]